MNYLDIAAAVPLLTLIVFALGMLLLCLFGLCRHRLAWSLTACTCAWVFTWPQFFLSDSAFGGMLAIDLFGAVFTTIILAGAFLTFLLNERHLDGQRAYSGVEVDLLLIFAVCGAMIMVSAAHLLMLFLGFELLSLSVYVLAGIARGERSSVEGALKYFLLGSFSSAFLLYGIALTYAATGSMTFTEIAAVASPANELLLLALGMIVFGFAFKLSLVPFHVWTPDVYQGAPLTITGFMAVVVKVAAFGSFLRVIYVAFGNMSEVWVGLLWVICVATMSLGNLAALRQRSVKRMLAYSSIAHAGYALMGLVVMGSKGLPGYDNLTGQVSGGEATVFYLVVYSLMTIAAFGAILLATIGSESQYEHDSIESLSGLGWTHPFLGIVMTIAILSLAGFPPFAGFIGKFYLFNAVIRSGFIGLAVIAAINSVVSIYYYLRVLVFLYFTRQREVSWLPPEKYTWASGAALTAVTFGTVYLGLFSEGCFSVLEAAIRSLG